MTGRRRWRQFAALPDLRLSPLEVFTQRQLQPRPPRLLRRGTGALAVVVLIGHGDIVRCAIAGNPRRDVLTLTIASVIPGPAQQEPGISWGSTSGFPDVQSLI